MEAFDYPEIDLIIEPGDIPRAGSREIAERFGEAHDKLLREIEELKSLCDPEFAALNFKLAAGPEYHLGYAAFLLLALQYDDWRIKGGYRQAFGRYAESSLPEVTERQLSNLTQPWYPYLKQLVKAVDAGGSWLELAAIGKSRPRWLGKHLARAKRFGLRVNCPAWRNVNKVTWRA
jgi:hypothetical protein